MSGKPRILIVDDDIGIRALVRRTFAREFDVDIVEASDGAIALERLSTAPVDLVILDLLMPSLSGLETLEAIRRSKTYSGIPVLVLSGNRGESQVRRSLELAADDFVAKPFNPAMLASRCRLLLERSRKPKTDPPPA